LGFSGNFGGARLPLRGTRGGSLGGISSSLSLAIISLFSEMSLENDVNDDVVDDDDVTDVNDCTDFDE
jgi:hypothetical protein